MDYKDTINLPQTAFAMKANLANREPGMIEAWEKAGLYRKLLRAASIEINDPALRDAFNRKHEGLAR